MSLAGVLARCRSRGSAPCSRRDSRATPGRRASRGRARRALEQRRDRAAVDGRGVDGPALLLVIVVLLLLGGWFNVTGELGHRRQWDIRREAPASAGSSRQTGRQA